MASKVRVGIIGAGISGLSTAYFLQKASSLRGLEINLDIFESSDHIGGVIRTEKFGDFLLEVGPEAFVSAKPVALELIEELGLSHDVIGSNDRLRQTYVVDNGKLHPLAEGMVFLAPMSFRSLCSSSLISTGGKLRTLYEPFVKSATGDPSVRSFLERRLGSELTAKIAEPLVSAICGGDIGQLSAVSALPEVYQVEQKFGSLWKGLRAVAKSRPHSTWPFFLTPRDGMSQLVDRLVSRLGDTSIHRGIRNIRVSFASNAYRLQSTNFEWTFDVLILCTPAFASAEIIAPVSPEAAHVLNQIPYTATAIVYLAYRRPEFSHPLNGFGFVVPEKEAAVLDACTWVSSKFRGRCPEDSVLLRCAVHDGRRLRSPASDEEISEKTQHELRRILGISCAPVFFRVFHNKKAMPQLNIGHAGKLERIESALAQHPGLFLSGAFHGGIGIPDCVRDAHQTAKAAVEFLQSSQAGRSSQRPLIQCRG